MNAPILRLYVFVIALFALLVASTTWNTVISASGLRHNPLNRRQLLEDQMIPRGTIFAADGHTVLARSHPGTAGLYVRSYPRADLFVHAIGYSYLSLGQVALERSANDDLTGQQSSVSGLLDQLQGRRRTGNDVVTTLDSAAQRLALDQIGANRGAIVAIEPASGRVLVLASKPTYDPNGLDPRRLDVLNHDNRDAPLVDRATQSGYPPGSTFKVVTATAALDSGRFSPSQTVNGDSPQTFSGTPLSNDFNTSYGPVDLTTALTKSINTVWANVAVALGRATMERYMRHYGFYAPPPIDEPSDQVASSGERDRRGRLLAPTSTFVDLGRMGIGQDKLSVTPLQMAMVASAIANGGRLMRPHIVDHVLDRDGRVVRRVAPEQQSAVMSADTAAKLTQMMTNVVQDPQGTGTAAALQGISIAGKTGTAEVGNGRHQVWFIAFAPVDHPRVAVAVTLENQDNSAFGGPTAGPIAKAVLQQLLGPGGGG